jgi:hypothetical protein
MWTLPRNAQTAGMGAVFVLSLVTTFFLLGFAGFPLLAVIPAVNAGIALKSLWETRTLTLKAPPPEPLKRIRDALYGGLLGGCLGGTTLAISYYGLAPAGQELAYSASILAAAMLVGATFSATFHLGIVLFDRMRAKHRHAGYLLNELTGAITGGIALGAALGVPLGIVFGSRPAPFVGFVTLIISVPLMAMCIGIFSVGYGRSSRLRQLVPSLLLANIVMIVVPAVAGLSFPSFFENIYWEFSHTHDYASLASGGAKLGGIFGGIIGLQVGMAMLLDRRTSA